MTEGSGLYLAGPALVKSAIGQQVTHEELGGAEMHAQLSGTIDFREEDDEACLAKIRRLVANIAPDSDQPMKPYHRVDSLTPARPATDLLDLVHPDPRKEYEIRDVLECIVDRDSFEEYKAEYGQSLVCGTARIGGFPIGIVANQHHQVRPANGPLQFGGVIYTDSAEKAARFVMSCNQEWLPILFLHDVNGFMVGRDSEQMGIIKAGAKLVNAVSNSRVAKITLLLGGSFGAGNYAQCGKAYDPRFVFAWPTARCAVMGGEQATSTLLDITIRSLERQGEQVDAEQLAKLRDKIRGDYEAQMDVRYAAARGWVDAIIDPIKTRDVLTTALAVSTNYVEERPFQLGVFQT